MTYLSFFTLSFWLSLSLVSACLNKRKRENDCLFLTLKKCSIGSNRLEGNAKRAVVMAIFLSASLLLSSLKASSISEGHSILYLMLGTISSGSDDEDSGGFTFSCIIDNN